MIRERKRQKKETILNANDLLEYQKENRIIGDFVLTEAAMPLPDNTIQLKEGFRIDDVSDDEHEKVLCVNVAVSAEHLFDLFTAMLIWLDDIVTLYIAHLNYEEGKIYKYFAYNKDVAVLLSKFENYRWMIQNYGELVLTFGSVSQDIQCLLDDTKLIRFYTTDVQPVIDFLSQFGLKEDKKMKFFPEGDFVTFGGIQYSAQLAGLLDDINIDESIVMEMEKEKESSGKRSRKK